MSQVGLEHDATPLVRVHARAFAQRELQLLDQVAQFVCRAQRTAGHVARHEHDAGARHPDDVSSDLAQPRR